MLWHRQNKPIIFIENAWFIGKLESKLDQKWMKRIQGHLCLCVCVCMCVWERAIYVGVGRYKIQFVHYKTITPMECPHKTWKHNVCLCMWVCELLLRLWSQVFVLKILNVCFGLSMIQRWFSVHVFICGLCETMPISCLSCWLCFLWVRPAEQVWTVFIC